MTTQLKGEVMAANDDGSANLIIGIILASLFAYVLFTFFKKQKTNGTNEIPDSTTSSISASDAPPGGFTVSAGQLSDIKLGSMTEVEVGETGMKVLVSRTADGNVYATGSKCPHYGAPLKNGVLSEDRIICPWHAAHFDCKTGDIEDGPVVDGLPTYTVAVDGGEVLIHVPKIDKQMKRVPNMCSKKRTNKTTYVIIGAGPAGGAAAEAMRSEGFTGSIIMLTKEEFYPYDRVKLSKAMSMTADKLQFRTAAFYKEHDIDVLLGKAVKEVNTETQTIFIEDAEPIKYDKLLIACGTFCRSFRKPESFTIEGAELDNIFTLRTIDDANRIEEHLESPSIKVVIVGSSFIGMETAGYLVNTKKIESVTVVGMEAFPFERVLGPEIGQRMMQLHESKGVKFFMKSTVGKFFGTGGKVTGCAIKDSNGNITDTIDADVVIIGSGVIPATEFLKGIELGPMGAIKVDEYLAVRGSKNIYAAGDIAMYPHWATGQDVRIEHFPVAMQQGRTAGKNMSGGNYKYDAIPFFWTSQYTTNIRYAGYATMVTERIIVGNVEAMQFVAYFVTGDGDRSEVSAVVTVGVDPVAVAAQELLRRRVMPSPRALRGSDLMTLVHILKGL